MNLKNVWEVCEFSDEIKYGKLDRKKFAVELYEVLSGDADEIYLDPVKFLENTYLTSDMRVLLAGALRRLARNEGNAVYVLDTEFGGGKTHSLLLLYHVFGNKDKGTEYIRNYELDKEYGILEVPDVKVVAIDCRKMEKNTLWGEIAQALGKYDLMKEYDLEGKPPKNINEIRNLFESPTLILIDELPVYLVNAESVKIGDTNLMKLTLNFIVVLSSAVSTSYRTMLVLTLTGRQSLYEKVVSEVKKSIKEAKLQERVETVHDHFTSALSRQAQYLVPVRDEEIYLVLRKRLVKSYDRSEAQRIIDAFYDYYLEKALISEADYKRKMERAYPFHPFLIDVLHERVSTIDKFNKTRGALWLLSTVLHRICMGKKDCKLVTTGDIPLEDATIRDALTSQLDKSEYINAINTDVVEKAKKIDESRNVKIAERIARTIYIYSLIAAAKISGIRPAQIKLAICHVGEGPDLVDGILQEMEREFWYLRKEGNEYYFWIEPGINKVIQDYKREVTEEEIKNTVLNTLKSLFKDSGHFKVVWDPYELDDDSDNLRIFVSLNPLTKDNIEKIMEQLPGSEKPRVYKNTLVVVFPDEWQLEEVKREAREVCAIKKAEGDSRIKPDKTKIKELRDRLNEAEGNLTAACQSAFVKIAYPKVGSGDIDPEEIILYDKKDDKKSRESKNLTERVISFLTSKGKFRDSLSVESIIDADYTKNQLNKDGYVAVREIYDLFRKDRRLPFIASGKAIIDAAREGVANSKFGYTKTLERIDGRYKAVIGKKVSVDWDGYIVRKDLVYTELEAVKDKTTELIEWYPREGVGASTDDSQDSWTILVEPEHRYSVSITSFEMLKDLLNKILIVKTIGEVKPHLSVSIESGGDIFSIESNLNDVNKLKQLIERIKEAYSQGKVKGELSIVARKDISEDLQQYGIDFKRG